MEEQKDLFLNEVDLLVEKGKKALEDFFIS